MSSEFHVMNNSSSGRRGDVNIINFTAVRGRVHARAHALHVHNKLICTGPDDRAYRKRRLGSSTG